MKCTRCYSQVMNKEHICPNCGTNMTITQELINSAINKNDFATSELYNRTYDDVYRVISFLIKDNDTIYDIEQMTYIQAFDKLTQLNSPSSFLPWVKTIARNKSIDYLRKVKKNAFVESFDSLNEQYDEEGLRLEAKLPDNNAVLPIDAVDKKETHMLLQEILDSIPEEQRYVVSMFYFDGFSIKEIAETVGCSESTIKSRLVYGRKNIQKEVLLLEKKGTKLYGLAPIPFFMFLLKVYNSIPVSPLPASILASVQSAIVGTTVASSVASTTATVAATASKGIALKVTAGIVAGVVAVSGGVVGGKKIYDKVKNDPTTTKPSTSVSATDSPSSTVATTATTPMTTVHMYKELSNSDTNYIKTLLAYTVDNENANYSTMSDSEMVDVLSKYYRVKENLKDSTDFFKSAKVITTQGGPPQVQVSQKDFKDLSQKAFGKTLSDTASSDNVQLKNGNYYFDVPMDGHTYDLNIDKVQYNKDKSKVTVTYTFNGGSNGEQTTVHTATFNRNGENKSYPFKIVSGEKSTETPTETTTESTTYSEDEIYELMKRDDLPYEGKVVDFGDFTIKVPNSWVYEKGSNNSVIFYEPKTKAKGGGARLSSIVVSDSWSGNNMNVKAKLLGQKNHKYYISNGIYDVQAYMEDGQKPTKEWQDIYNNAYVLVNSVLATFKIK